MRLRTVTGQRWPAKCADGCGATIPPGEGVRLVVDLDSKPRKAWLPEHSPDAGTWNRGRGQAGPSGDPGNPPAQTARPGYPKPPEVPAPDRALQPSSPVSGATTAAQLLSSSPMAPGAAPTGSQGASSKASPPSPSSSEGDQGGEDCDPAPSSPTPHAGRTWTSGSLALASVRTGLAAYARPGESDESLLIRVNALLVRDLEAKLRAVKALRESLGIAERGRAGRAKEEA